MNDDEPTLVYDMFYFFYTGHYPVDTVNDGHEGIRISNKHIDMYNLATKYSVTDLQQYAAQAFHLHIPQCTTAHLLDSVGPVYLMEITSPFRELLLEEAAFRHRELMAPGSRAQNHFLETLRRIPGFQFDLLMRFFEAGANTMCRGCRGYIDQSLFCQTCEPVELVKMEANLVEEQAADGEVDQVVSSSPTLFSPE